MGNKQPLLWKQAILFVAAGLALLLYLNIPVYKALYNGKLAGFPHLASVQLDHLSISDRYKARFGDQGYLLTQYIKYYVDSPKVANPLILLPPTSYFKVRNYDAIVTEPVVYYYFTGYSCITPQSANVYAANYAAYLREGRPAMIRLQTKEQVDVMLKHYQSHP